MKTYQIELTGVTPLLMHKDNIQGGEMVKAWSKDPANKKLSAAGDDRTPAWTWITYLYTDHAGRVGIDSDNIMSMLAAAGKKCPAEKGKGSQKALAAQACRTTALLWEIEFGGKKLNMKDLEGLRESIDFEEHLREVEKLGFQLLVKRAAIQQKKHIRVRPMFAEWKVCGEIMVCDEAIMKKETLKQLFSVGGSMVGLCDWRPGSPTPGQYGMFKAEVK